MATQAVDSGQPKTSEVVASSVGSIAQAGSGGQGPSQAGSISSLIAKEPVPHVRADKPAGGIQEESRANDAAAEEDLQQCDVTFDRHAPVDPSFLGNHTQSLSSRGQSRIPAATWTYIKVLTKPHPLFPASTTHICVHPLGEDGGSSGVQRVCNQPLKLHKNKTGSFVSSKAVQHLAKNHPETKTGHAAIQRQVARETSNILLEGCLWPSGSPIRPATESVSGVKWSKEVSLESLRESQERFARDRRWEQHHTPRNIAMALVGEVGELVEIFQWRKDEGCQPGLPGWKADDIVHVGEEMSDVLLYLIRMADVCGIDLAGAVQAKIIKNGFKYPAHLVDGSSQKYTAYAATSEKAGSAGQDKASSSTAQEKPSEDKASEAAPAAGQSKTQATLGKRSHPEKAGEGAGAAEGDEANKSAKAARPEGA